MSLAALAPWLGLGALGWALGVAAKLPLVWPLRGWLARTGPRRAAVAEGLLSAAGELGVLALLLAWRGLPGDAASAFALGAGAGLLEAVLLGVGAWWPAPATEPGATESGAAEPAAPEPVAGWPERSAFFAERFLVALPMHMGTRALLATAAPWAVAAAVAGFTLADGLPGYGERTGWAWTDRRTLWGYYALVGAVGWALVGLAGLAWLGR